jgi:hypothetical protein
MTATWANARQACRAAGGDLVAYSSPAEQQLVENYFSNSGTIGSSLYWIGASRTGAGQPYTSVSGPLSTMSGPLAERLPQTYSLSPYAHWSWLFYSRLSVGSHNCAVARSASKYDYFNGDSTLDASGYASPSDDKKYGWDVAACNDMYTFICEARMPGPCHWER